MSIITIIAAFFGTWAFAILFDIPKKYCIYCGFIGMIAWISYSFFVTYLFGEAVSIFLATAIAAFISRIAAVRRKSPEIIFLVAGIIPLIPGVGIYWTAYYLFASQMEQASRSGSSAIRAVISIVLGIVIIHELPSKIFARFASKR